MGSRVKSFRCSATADLMFPAAWPLRLCSGSAFLPSPVTHEPFPPGCFGSRYPFNILGLSPSSSSWSTFHPSAPFTPFLCQSVSCAFNLGPSDASRLEPCKDGSSQVDSGDSTHICTRRPGRTQVPTPASGPFLPSSRSCRRVVFLPQSLCTR